MNMTDDTPASRGEVEGVVLRFLARCHSPRAHNSSAKVRALSIALLYPTLIWAGGRVDGWMGGLVGR